MASPVSPEPPTPDPLTELRNAGRHRDVLMRAYWRSVGGGREPSSAERMELDGADAALSRAIMAVDDALNQGQRDAAESALRLPKPTEVTAHFHAKAVALLEALDAEPCVSEVVWHARSALRGALTELLGAPSSPTPPGTNS